MSLSSLEKTIKARKSAVDYYKQYYNTRAELELGKNIPCEFHKEQNGKSLRISKDGKTLTCYGKCHKTWDVVDLHAELHNMERDESIVSLASLLGIKEEKVLNIQIDKVTMCDKEKKEYAVAYNAAISIANSKDLWIELDYIMSFNKPLLEKALDLRLFYKKHKEVNN